MYPAKFEYHRASSVEDAVALLHRHKDSKLLAGGHSLVPMMKLRLAQPAAVIDIGGVHILRGITRHNGSIRVGALTTHAEIAASDLVRGNCALLGEAAGKIGDPQVRNKGTLGGNIAHADPASDPPAVLVALDATINITGPTGDRTVAAEDFFVGLLETAAGDHDILTAVDIPRLPGGCGTSYQKFEHPASGYAICAAAAVVRMEGGVCKKVRLVIGGVSATPYHAAEVGAALVSSALADSVIEAAVDEHLAIEDPLGDIQASGEYRVELAKVFGKRALKLARDRALA